MDGVAIPDLDDVQGLLRSAYRTLPHAAYSLYQLRDSAGGRRFLSQLTDAATPATARDTTLATQVALTSSGLQAIGLPDDIAFEFSSEFVSGMSAPERSRFLGDRPAEWAWGRPDGPPVHLLVATFADTATRLDDTLELLERNGHACGAAIVDRLVVADLREAEPFGFRDGISQPFVAELATERQRAATAATTRPVPLGEFVLGYANIYGFRTQRPVVPSARDPRGLLPAVAPDDDPGYPHGGADLGRNGSYLVLRTLAQDVDGFGAYVTEAASGAGMDPDLLAAKMVGRWRSGAPLALSPDIDRPELADANAFGYHHEDAAGLRCPIGAHIRRANPRDSLDPRPGSDRSLAVTDRHRLIRRGRSYDGPQGQGLQFLAFNANLGRQFEFIQHTWLNNPKFGALYDDVDPLLAPRQTVSVFTVPGSPFRRRFTSLPDFVATRGGAYFFLPGIRALHYLASGSW